MMYIYKDGVLQNHQTDNPYLTVKTALGDVMQSGQMATFTVADGDGRVIQSYTNRIIWGSVNATPEIAVGVVSSTHEAAIKFDATYAVLKLPYQVLISLTDESDDALQLATQCTGVQSPSAVTLVNAIAEFFGVQELNQISRDLFQFVVDTASRCVEQLEQSNTEFIDIETYIQEGKCDWKFVISLELDTGEIQEARPQYSRSVDHGFDQTELDPPATVRCIYRHYREQAISILNGKKMTKKDWFFKLLESTDCISVGGGPLLTKWDVYPQVKGSDQVVLSFSWIDSDSVEVDEDFTNEAIEKITVRSDGAVILENTMAEPTSLELYKLTKLTIPSHV